MNKESVLSYAAGLSLNERKNLALQCIKKDESIVKIAKDNKVSRKFVYQQKSKAEVAVDNAFLEKEKNDDVLFYIPVTKAWIKQVVLSLVLIAHCSLRGVSEFLMCTMDYSLSHSTVDNIVKESILSVKKIDEHEDFSKIQYGANDEIYQAGKPVLAGVDLVSTYCYLLTAEDHCDETTWGVRLLEAQQKGLDLQYTVADGGKGLRAGQAAALEGVPCHGDVFHAERDLGKLVFFLSNRSKSCSKIREQLERKVERAKKKGNEEQLLIKLASAIKEEVLYKSLARDTKILSNWMNNDILSLSGASYQIRKEMYDFIVEELRVIEKHCPHRIKPVRSMFQNSREQLLAFVEILEDKLEEIAKKHNVSVYVVQKVCEIQGLSKNKKFYWEQRSKLKLHGKYFEIEIAVNEAMSKVYRASSLVENLNSRLRNYFSLRRHIGNDYLVLLRFFLNHRKFIRSDRPERVGKSPAQLLSGKEHSHWLELLGFSQFKRKDVGAVEYKTAS